MSRPRALDLFCGAGGAAMGLHRAGFDVVGVDIAPQPRYPFTFVQGDALEFPIDGFEFVWASPPCQRYSPIARARGVAGSYPDLIPPVRARLRRGGLPFVIENVPGAPLERALELCGSMFGLGVWRHRRFELSFSPALLTPPCNHREPPIAVYGHGPDRSGKRYDGMAARSAAMGIDWMTRDELSEAIPPAMSEFLARAFLATERGR